VPYDVFFHFHNIPIKNFMQVRKLDICVLNKTGQWRYYNEKVNAFENLFIMVKTRWPKSLLLE
jgi:hypothetical protein